MSTSARSNGKKVRSLSQNRGRLLRDSFRLIKYLRGGRRTYRDISTHMGWKYAGSSENKTARRWIDSMYAEGIPVQSYRHFENDPMLFWLEKDGGL